MIKKHKKLIVRLPKSPGERGELQLWVGRRIIRRFPVVTGAPETPTPTGHFRIREINRNPHYRNPRTGEIIPPGRGCPLYPALIVLETQSGEKMNQSIHGTTRKGLRKGAQSHGCMRMRRTDIRKLLPHVHVGMPVMIKP